MSGHFHQFVLKQKGYIWRNVGKFPVKSVITQLHISDKTSRYFSDGSVAKLQNNYIETAGNHSRARGNMEGVWAWDHVSVTTKWEAFKETLQYYRHIYGNRRACCDETWTFTSQVLWQQNEIISHEGRTVSSCGCGDRSRCFKPNHDVVWPEQVVLVPNVSTHQHSRSNSYSDDWVGVKDGQIRACVWL